MYNFNIDLDKIKLHEPRYTKDNITKEDLIDYITDPLSEKSSEMYRDITCDMDSACLYPSVIREFGVQEDDELSKLLKDIRNAYILSLVDELSSYKAHSDS